MANLITRVFYYIYGRPLKTILIWTALAFILWTVTNLVVPKKVSRVMNFAGVLVMLIAITFLTLINRSANAVAEVELVPFWAFRKGHFQELWLNAFLFFPFGLTLPYVLPDKIKNKVATTILIAALFSFFIELTQLIFRLGLCETDDLIMNTLGAVIGMLSYIFVSHIKTKKNKRE